MSDYRNRQELPRGIRNNNPGNIRKSPENWLGLAPDQTDPAFFVFTDAKYGIRAAARILKNYQKKYGLNTVKKIITRWAPTIENDTESYINHVASSLGVRVDEQIDLSDKSFLLPLVRTIFRHENGTMPYSMDELIEGISLA